MRFLISYLIDRQTTGQVRIARSFAAHAAAEDFIAVNATLSPLPGLAREYDVRSDLDFSQLR
jgi:hypothetical protein